MLAFPDKATRLQVWIAEHLAYGIDWAARNTGGAQLCLPITGFPLQEQFLQDRYKFLTITYPLRVGGKTWVRC